LHTAGPDDLVLNLAKMRSARYIRRYAAGSRYPNMSLSDAIPLALVKRQQLAITADADEQNKRRRTTMGPPAMRAASTPRPTAPSTHGSPWTAQPELPWGTPQTPPRLQVPYALPQTPPRQQIPYTVPQTPTRCPPPRHPAPTHLHAPHLYAPHSQIAYEPSLLFAPMGMPLAMSICTAIRACPSQELLCIVENTSSMYPSLLKYVPVLPW